jgi:hypothetical protein
VVDRYIPSPLIVLRTIEREHLTTETKAIADHTFESSVGTKSHSNMDNSSSDAEKGDFKASPSEPPETTITAQDWTGPDDRDNPQNW